jgi:PAS domain S-box-containing protein
MEATSLIAKGRLDAGIEAGSRDEIGELAWSFRKMAADLHKNMVSRRYMDSIINSMIDGVMVVDTGACIRTVNPSLCSMLGYTGAELLGSPLGMILPEGPSFLLEVLQKGGTENVEKALKRKDGDEVPVLMSAAAMQEDGEVKGIVCAALNISERKRLEEQVLNSRKLESIGILASGIAHDFNNFLTAVMGNLNLAKLSMGREDEARKRLLAAERATINAKHLSQQLLTFTKGGVPIKEAADISALVRETAQFALSGSRVKCDISSENGLWPVRADERQLSQVVHNIVHNAQGAMPEGGVIMIHCANTTLETGEVPPLQGGRYVRVSFEDNGSGIPEENLSRIFDPYFTTKSKGIGLGLATSYSIVKRHGGHLGVESEVGRGSVFHVYLLAAEGEAPLKRDAGTEEIEGSGRVLIMDDEEMVRDSTGEMLKMLGYHVEFACDGREALERYGRAMEAGRGFDAVIMDLTIPGGMGGREAIQRLRALDPGARAIVSSGYCTDPVMAEFERHGFRAYVAKPYKIEELGLALKRVMAEGRASPEG